MVSWDGLKRKIANFRLQSTLEEILSTPPVISVPDSPLVFVSQLHPRDLFAYMLAIKSVMQSISQAAVIVVDDGLAQADKNILASHIENIEIRPIQSIERYGLQAGGTWERLITLIQESNHRYAMQIDSDIVATGALDHVLDCIHNNISFALTDHKTTGYVTLSETAEWIQHNESHSAHIQYAFESQANKMPKAEHRRYIKATSAFTGFAKGSAQIDDLIEFSSQAQALHGQRWTEWGTEQISSNYLIANTTAQRLLPWPEYINHMPNEDINKARLIHFFGTYRFYKNRYKNIAAQKINSLKNAKSS